MICGIGGNGHDLQNPLFWTSDPPNYPNNPNAIQKHVWGGPSAPLCGAGLSVVKFNLTINWQDAYDIFFADDKTNPWCGQHGMGHSYPPDHGNQVCSFDSSSLHNLFHNRSIFKDRWYCGEIEILHSLLRMSQSFVASRHSSTSWSSYGFAGLL